MNLRPIALLAMCFQVTCGATAKEAEMPKSFTITMDHRVFTVTPPVPPEREFAKHQPFVPLGDDSLFVQSEAARMLQVHWKFRRGLLGRVAGVLEMQVFMRNTRDVDATRDQGLQEALWSYYKRELTKVRYTGGPFAVEKVTIGGTPWVRYEVPVLRTMAWSTALSSKRILSVQFALVDNTGEENPAWAREANELMNQIVASLRVE